MRRMTEHGRSKCILQRGLLDGVAFWGREKTGSHPSGVWDALRCGILFYVFVLFLLLYTTNGRFVLRGHSSLPARVGIIFLVAISIVE